jgi:hypothetical protein
VRLTGDRETASGLKQIALRKRSWPPPLPPEAFRSRRRLARASLLGLLTLSIVCLGLLAATPAVARPAHVHRLHAAERVKTWRTPQRWGPEWMVYIEAYVHGRHVPDHTEGCRTEWTGRGVAIEARVCGKGDVPIRLRYVSYQGQRDITVRYYAIRQASG